MNNQRRTLLQKIVNKLEDILCDEQDAFDNMPENLQDAKKGDTVQENIDQLNEAKDILEEIIG